ncbi:MAG TPA: DUF5996 family protein [Steroidobacter sp.]|uniref:DUF5996 family protein n=1 Tax=Steroidobacter sp. TaxID=1978227 RepID=UPI002ED9EC7C
MVAQQHNAWPALPYEAWKDTCATLHLWTQIIGKIRLARTPWVNHGWHVTLYVTARGLTTSPVPFGERTADITFDFIAHELRIEVSDGHTGRIALRPQSVADFYAAVMEELRRLDLEVSINERPSEIADAVPFSQDHSHNAYDAEHVQRFWRALVQIDDVMKQFRSAFLGKVSPVHFFWGSFDLAVTRFSGRTAPLFTGQAPGLAQEVMQEAYSHEVSSAGFWPGGNGVDHPSFYSYVYPTSDRFKTFSVQPAGAVFSDTLGEYLLPYDTVRSAADPAATLLSFFQTTYEAAAISANWDRAALECPLGAPGVPRALNA